MKVSSNNLDEVISFGLRSNSVTQVSTGYLGDNTEHGMKWNESFNSSPGSAYSASNWSAHLATAFPQVSPDLLGTGTVPMWSPGAGI